ncbi:IQ domain-containing protein C isoform X1 [Anguilla rostrata]|uniref:IQ domain-containing protein C isoform X1 n=1 Tax=Anguilla rostrata TaxID=7938 RepID=UPI0030CCAA67
MERQDLERIITDFQAKARGFLVRKELSGVRQDYEDIVSEIEGDLSHLEWRGGIIAIPLFTKNAFVWQRNKSPSSENPEEPSRVSELTQLLGKPGEGTSQEVQLVISDTQVAMRELHQQEQYDRVPAVRDSGSSGPAEGDGDLSLGTETRGRVELQEGGDPGSVVEDTLVWDSTAMDAGYSLLRKGSPRRSQVKDIPRKQEDLCLHRNNLSMELLWLQQAINSRKKYLLLKQRLGLPER